MEPRTALEAYTEIMNDPVKLAEFYICEFCCAPLDAGSVAFAIENYAGDYIGYVCPACHPNRKWIWALWRDLFNVNLLEIPIKPSKPIKGTVTRTVH